MSALFRPGDRPWLHLGLLVATAITTFGSFYLLFSNGPDQVAQSLWFSGSLLTILGSHEMGHYVLARKHQVDTTLPYFIPAPFGVGTLGAVIRIRSRIPDKNALVDIGAAGPLAGLVVAIPVLLLGLSWSTITQTPPMPETFPGPNSLWVLLPKLFDALTRWLSGEPSVATAMTKSVLVFGDNLLLRGLQAWILGPIPPGHDVIVHPLVIAGWFGLLVTMLNLLPIGQLDGGHLSYALFGDAAQWVGRVMILGMAFLCVFFSAGWVVWLLITTKVIGVRHPEVVRGEVPLTRGRKGVCALCALALVVCIIPVPIMQVMVP